MHEKLNVILRRNQMIEEGNGKPIISRNIHLPMTLSALAAMGASDQRLEEAYLAAYEQDPPVDRNRDKIVITTENWQDALGQYSCFQSYLHYFRQVVEEDGVESTLEQHVPKLITGISAHAFHPFLRLGYALDTNISEEAIFALAYWAATYYELPEVSDTFGSISMLDFLDNLQNTPTLAEILFTSDMNIDDRLKLVLTHPDFNSQLAPIKFSEDNGLQEMSRLLLKLFMLTKDFTVLHGVTSCHMLRNIQPYITNQTEFLSGFWHVIGAAYVTVGAPPINANALSQEEDTAHLLDWDEIKARATESTDDHVIKFTYTCCQQSEFDPLFNDFYRRAARSQIESPAEFSQMPLFSMPSRSVTARMNAACAFFKRNPYAVAAGVAAGVAMGVSWYMNSNR